MNLRFLFLPPILLIQLIPFVKTYTLPIIIILSLIILPHSSKTENNLLHKHTFIPSAIQALRRKESFFDLPNIEQFRTIENNPHHWLTTDIHQIHHFQYQCFQNLTLNTQIMNKIESNLYFFVNSLDIITNSIGILNSQTLVITFLPNFLRTNSSLLLIPLKLFFSINSATLLSLILTTSPMTIIALMKVLNFLLLLKNMQNIVLKYLL